MRDRHDGGDENEMVRHAWLSLFYLSL